MDVCNFHVCLQCSFVFATFIIGSPDNGDWNQQQREWKQSTCYFNMRISLLSIASPKNSNFSYQIRQEFLDFKRFFPNLGWEDISKRTTFLSRGSWILQNLIPSQQEDFKKSNFLLKFWALLISYAITIQDTFFNAKIDYHGVHWPIWSELLPNHVEWLPAKLQTTSVGWCLWCCIGMLPLPFKWPAMAVRCLIPKSVSMASTRTIWSDWLPDGRIQWLQVKPWIWCLL